MHGTVLRTIMKQKKAQEIGRNTILMIIILLLLLGVMAVYLWQSGQLINFNLDKLFS